MGEHLVYIVYALTDCHAAHQGCLLRITLVPLISKGAHGLAADDPVVPAQDPS